MTATQGLGALKLWASELWVTLKLWASELWVTLGKPHLTLTPHWASVPFLTRGGVGLNGL